MTAVTLASEVAAALDRGRAVVGVETSVLAHGLPPPRNLEAAERIDHAVREAGAVPAWAYVDGGAVRLGASPEDLRRLARPGAAAKVARRDLPAALAGGRLGATTVSAAIWAAASAGVEVGATGGIGGVHPGTGDVSADLMEMARTPGVLVCSGPKSIVDPAATAERLEELGVAVVGYRCDRMPFFVVADAGLPLEHRADSPGEVAAVARARREMALASTVLVCQPVPAESAVAGGVVAEAVRDCQHRADREGVVGKAVTPFLLRCLADLTGGATLEANLALLQANAGLAARIAVELAEGPGRPPG